MSLTGKGEIDSDESSEYRLGQLFDLVEINEEDGQLLKDLIKPRQREADDNSSNSAISQATRQKLLDLEKLIISPNDDIRFQAEYKLGQLIDQHRKDQEQVELDFRKTNFPSLCSIEQKQKKFFSLPFRGHIF